MIIRESQEADNATLAHRPTRKRTTRNPKRRRNFDLPDREDEEEVVIGPGDDPKP